MLLILYLGVTAYSYIMPLGREYMLKLRIIQHEIYWRSRCAEAAYTPVKTKTKKRGGLATPSRV